MTQCYRLNDKNFNPNEHNLYYLFGLKFSATTADIKSAYRRLTRKYHPDFHNGDKRFQDAFTIINIIYAILSDSSKRLEYDSIYRRKQSMLTWKFNPANYNAKGYQLIPPGKYRVRIEKAEETMTRTGKDMVRMTLKVSGYNSKVWYNLVFDNTNAEAIARTDDKLGRIYDSFNIQQGNMNPETWTGKVGAANIKNVPDNEGVMRAEISWFIKRAEQDLLPEWQEHPTATVNGEMADFESDLPPF